MELFVYGTLMRRLSNHGYLEAPGCRFLREVATVPGFSLLDLGEFPGMVKGGRGSVQGELFRVPRALLRDLDRLEGHPHFYWRTSIKLADRGEAVSYLLVHQRSLSSPRVPSGDWREHLAHRREGRAAHGGGDGRDVRGENLPSSCSGGVADTIAEAVPGAGSKHAGTS